MLRQTLPQSSPAARIRVSPEEFARALAAVETQHSDARETMFCSDDDTIAIGEALRELDVDATAEEVWQQVESAREQNAQAKRLRTARRQRTRRVAALVSLLGCVTALISGPAWYAKASALEAKKNGQFIAAVQRGDVEAVNHFLSQGYDPNARALTSSLRVPALSVAAHWGNTAVAEALLRAGADTNIKDNLGATPLHWVASHREADPRYIKTMRLLLSRGCNVNVKDERGITALDWAKSAGNAAFTKVLRQAGAKR